MKLTTYRGDTTVFDVACKQSDGSALNITTGTLWFTVKSTERQSDAQALLQKSTGDGIAVTDGPGGLATITLMPADTSEAYAPSELVWDLQYVSVGGHAYTLLTGKLRLLADVTRSIS